MLEGLQLYYESHGHLTSDSCECFFVNADMALWHSFWKNSKMHSQVLPQALRVHIRRRWSETSWIANVDRSLHSFHTHTDFSSHKWVMWQSMMSLIFTKLEYLDTHNYVKLSHVLFYVHWENKYWHTQTLQYLKFYGDTHVVSVIKLE